MASFSDILKTEIHRISKKATREPLTALQGSATRQRKQIVALTREVAALKRELALIRREVTRRLSVSAGPASSENIRFQARGLKSLRARLDLSANDFGALVGVSGLTIYNWENGKSLPQKESLSRLAEIRQIGKREAAARLENARKGK